jgi:hypothetical protein
LSQPFFYKTVLLNQELLSEVLSIEEMIFNHIGPIWLFLLHRINLSHTFAFVSEIFIEQLIEETILPPEYLKEIKNYKGSCLS